MVNDDIFTRFSIYLIKKIWHGKFGRSYNKKFNIICRFHPSCSNYAIMALEKYGFFKGWFLAFKRVSRCTIKNTESCIDYP
ncbi:MAG: membrane protein insertion efficiency factor YidD [Candidatus Nanoarchaeia archaeon]|jgi:putative component of membrane protein insertase Oxa1/YidC/SpoIIIJ protein YidD